LTTASLGLARSLYANLSYFWTAIRRNHAMEHATVHILAEHLPTLHVVGRTVPRGFFLYGDVDTQSLRQAAEEALTELGLEACSVPGWTG